MKKYILLISLSYYSICLSAQSLKESLQIADSIVSIDEQYAYGIYKRVYFFSDSLIEENVLIKLSKHSLNLKKYEESIKYTKKLLQKSNKDSDEITYYQQLLNLYLLAENYNELYTYINLNDTIQNANIKIRYINLFYKGLACIKLNNKNEALHCFSELWTLEKDSIKKEEIRVLNKKYFTSKNYNPLQGKVRSLIIPGLGQLYAKDYKNAANSFVLNASIISLMFITANQYTLLQSLLFWNQPLLHYYLGGANVAATITSTKINSENQMIMDKYLNVIDPIHPTN